MNKVNKSLLLLVPVLTCIIIFLVSCGKDDEPVNPQPVEKADTLTTGWSKADFSVSGSILDVFFFNNTTGMLVDGANGIHKSADGGLTWQKVYTSQGGIVNLYMSSINHAILVSTNNRVFVTRNGGVTFDSITLADPALYDVFCLNSNVAYVIGRYLWKTTDGGTTWVNLTDFNSAGKSVWFNDEMNGWAAGEFGLRKTSNGGANWQIVNISPMTAGQTFSMHFIDNSRGFIISDQYSSKTSDGGANWTGLHTPETNTFHDIHFIDANNGYITDGRYIVKTTSGGSTWQIVARMGGGFFIELHFTDLNHGWAGGSNGRFYRFQQ